MPNASSSYPQTTHVTPQTYVQQTYAPTPQPVHTYPQSPPSSYVNCYPEPTSQGYPPLPQEQQQLPDFQSQPQQYVPPTQPSFNSEVGEPN